MKTDLQMTITKQVLVLAFCLLQTSLFAQSIVGDWITVDDNTGEKKSVIMFYKVGDSYFGKVKTNLVGKDNPLCTKCEGDRKNKPIVGMVIIENLKKVGNEYTNGTVFDPETADTYKCTIELVGADKLKIRGYLGIPMFGRSQYWERKKD